MQAMYALRSSVKEAGSITAPASSCLNWLRRRLMASLRLEDQRAAILVKDAQVHPETILRKRPCGARAIRRD